MESRRLSKRDDEQSTQVSTGEFVLIKPSGFGISIDERRAILGTAVSILLKREEAKLSEIEAKYMAVTPRQVA